ncbi:uncharacterized protein LOC135612876 [Musa acuminata AAA Group]|uniref:uncharacterized protein LOC135612876 n=1 Tax=Musa acuminata AAA Group TaxID=214697 RepID=UPI0031D71A56
MCLTEVELEVLLDNGIVQLTLSKPGGSITGVRYHGLDNVAEIKEKEDGRGYWDLVWNPSDRDSGIFQKWVEAEPLATITESQVERFVWRNLITRFGLPQSIVTDNGPQFAGRRFQEFCAKHRIQLRFSSVAYPQANGLAEVTNRSIIDGLKRRVSATRSAWIDELPSVLWALRTTPKTPTGESPYSLTFGTEAVLPSEVAVPTPRTTDYSEEASGEGLRSNLDLLEERRADAHQKALSYKRAVARVYNRSVRPRSIKLEDLVLRKIEVSHPTQVRGKLAPKILGTEFDVVQQDANHVEVSFRTKWDPSHRGKFVPLNIDKRFVMLRGSSGFYTYAIYEHLQGWPDFNLGETRVVFKLRKDKFHYMAIADNGQRIMPMPDDRRDGRSHKLGYPEAVRLIDPTNVALRGEVDDKYQYSSENKDSLVHGWISSDPSVGFWVITPSNEFKSGGPVRQDLTSHVGPTALSVSMFVSSHYSGVDTVPKFRNGEYWKKVFGPVFIYLNSAPDKSDPKLLWEDAQKQMQVEVEKWPYDFPASEDFHKSEQRGSVSGRLLVLDKHISKEYINGNAAFVGLASPGEAGSWQRESKGYQFWVKADVNGNFFIKNVRTGVYNLYAWVPGFIGDYKSSLNITVTSGNHINLGSLVYNPPRDGPTLWEIGIPDRSAAEFFVPDPDPKHTNRLYVDHSDRFRQYGLWERYADLYPDGDLIYTIGVSDYRKDWFYAQVTRKDGQGSHQATTWQIRFRLDSVHPNGPYKLRVALAAAHLSELQVRFNNPRVQPAHFTTRLIGRDNSIARQGIHGLYWLFSIDVESSWLLEGDNIIFLTQTRCQSPFQGVMYDYIRMEAPADSVASTDDVVE